MAGGVVAGRDVTITNGRCHIGVAGRDLNFKNGFGGIVNIGNQAQIENSKIGLLLARSEINLNNSEIFVTGKQVLVFGVITGLVFVLVNGLKNLQK